MAAGGALSGYRVLACSAGTSPALGIVKCFRFLIGGPNHVVTTDLHENVPAAALADRHYLVPPYRSEEYFARVQEIVDNEAIEVVFPTHLDEILAFSGRVDSLPDWYRRLAVMNPPAVVAAANDKAEMNRRWAERGGAVPRTFDTLAEVLSSDLPVILKPAVGKSRGYDQVTRICTARDLRSAPSLPEGHLIQELVRGSELSIDFIASEGTVLGACARTRESTSLGISMTGVTVDATPFAADLRRAVEALPGIRFANLQIICDEAGRHYLVEVNPKLPGTLIHSAAAGLNMPHILADMVTGRPFDKPVVRSAVRMMRYTEELFRSEDGAWRRLAD